ncbi:hypothetical protein LTH96_12040 [Nesterenkonia sp. LB17]|uniref:hypothetical protein n=1 Tax=Nesterenkonia sp. LB17 TaxID=2901230 RepID=UPI001F4CF7A4|nr:hypothetical protein [Nesterenkonia sp. LB17]MCH8566445.1 hypothetical protein [Nesterenkonia sp. LB17]
MEHTESGFLSAVQGLPIPSSALIALIAVLFLGALVLRGRRQASSFTEAAPTVQDGPTITRETSLRSLPASTEPMTSTTAHPDTHRGATMSSTTESSATASSTTESSTTESSRSASGFQLHWGRTLVALLGVLALLTAVVTGILAPLTAVPAALPLSAAGVFLLALVAMRTMAVLRRRSRRRARVQSAIEEAMNPLQSSPWVNPADAGLFDALSADDRGAGGPNSLQQIDEDGLPVGLERTFGAEVQTAGPVLGDAAEPVGPWQPRSVPRPKYLDLDKAERIEPEALAVQTPVPRSDVKLTQRRFLDTSAPAEQTPAAQQSSTEQNPPVDQIKAPKHDSMNLDEVLKRRRA